MPDSDGGLAARVFDHARNDFLMAVDRWLADRSVDPETRTAEVAFTREVLAAKLRLVNWG